MPDDHGWPVPRSDPFKGYGATGGFYGSTGNESLYAVILEVANERLDQRAEYGEAGDDTLEPSEWVARLVKHLGRAVTIEPRVFRTQLVRVAAICVAAIESFDRRFPE